MKQIPTVSIIFPNYNGGHEPLDCLASIKKLKFPQEKIEIIVIDNNSTDNSAIMIKQKYPGIKLIKMKRNYGFAKAVNIGINKSGGDYIFIANDDLVFEENSLKIMVNYLLKNKQTGLVGGKIYYKYKPHNIASSGFYMNKWTGNIFRAKQVDKIKEPDWCQGCAILIPHAILKQVGLLDSQYVLSFDDYDLCLRIKKAGFKIMYLPTALFWHGESLTVDKNKYHKYFHWYKSKLRFIIKHLPFIQILSIILVQTLFIIPYRVLILRDGRFLPFVKGLWWNLKNLSQTLNERQRK